MPAVAIGEKLESHIQELKQAVANEETLIFDTNICVKSAYDFLKGAIARLRKNAESKKKAEPCISQLFSYIENKYLPYIHQYFVRVASKYLHLLNNVIEINELPEVQKKLSPRVRTKERKRLELLKREFDEYEALQTKLTVMIQRWKEKTEQKHFPGFKTSEQYKEMANELEQQLSEFKKDMERFGNLVQKQNTIRFQTLINMAEALQKLIS